MIKNLNVSAHRKNRPSVLIGNEPYDYTTNALHIRPRLPHPNLEIAIFRINVKGMAKNSNTIAGQLFAAMLPEHLGYSATSLAYLQLSNMTKRWAVGFAPTHASHYLG